ncbi:JAB domain-containing protein [Sphingobium sp. CAP-1]|uniref:JAB domain-containing protein n=1 Tax=Sphingobium sp. CAP-1 TaxID=2676077 RepID=UPI0012BB3995|nr:JAB domain-containing protein [Sphingobium sp. CAP-1]QGP78243.1 hypothetical protein GL174_03975 [Sphingobium sp. CAP-1]
MTHDGGLLLALLDEDWRPRHMLPLRQEWHLLLPRLLADEGSWIALLQRRDPGESPLPRPTDIVLTRNLARSLRPLDLRFADHVIAAGEARFSFRAAGLL